MLKKLGYMICGALIAGMVASAYAVIGVPPGTGPGLTDGAWLNGLAAGHNRTFVAGLTAIGTTQATSLQLTPQIKLYEIDTAAAGTGVALPAAVAGGIEASIFNNGANIVTVFPQITNNPVTAAQDVINGGTSTALTPTSSLACFVARAGRWSCK